jgi:putative hydrolase of HD superfamily
MDAPPDPDAVALAAYAFELGVLKNLRRTGWAHAGIRDAESVAEHSLRVAQLAALIAAEEGADPARAAFLALWHDTQETPTGDLPHTARPYLARPVDPRAITNDQVTGLPRAAAAAVTAAVAEHEDRESVEARCARDADKLECLVQALEYRAAGNTKVDGWITSSRDALTTGTARRIAAAAERTSTLAWRDR